MSSDVRKGGPSTGKTRRNTAWRSPKRNIPFKCARWSELESDAGLSASVVPLRQAPPNTVAQSVAESMSGEPHVTALSIQGRADIAAQI